LWFTVLFAPVVPIRRVRLALMPHRGNGFSVRELERTRLVASELLRTWVFSLIVVPLLAAVPFVALAVLRLVTGKSDGIALNVAFGVAMLCFGAFIWKLMDWHQERFHPNGK